MVDTLGERALHRTGGCAISVSRMRGLAAENSTIARGWLRIESPKRCWITPRLACRAETVWIAGLGLPAASPAPKSGAGARTCCAPTLDQPSRERIDCGTTLA